MDPQSNVPLPSMLESGRSMNRFKTRIAKLEMAIAPAVGRPFCVWGTLCGGNMRRKTEQEIQVEIDDAMASGAMAAIDRPVVISWKMPQ